MSQTCRDCEYLNLNIEESHNKYLCTKYNNGREKNDAIAETCGKFKEREYKAVGMGEYKPSGCYITTILVKLLGKEDNCSELEHLRTLRSEMQLHPEYRNLLVMYDVIGPKIAENLANDPHGKEKARELYESCIKTCDRYLLQENFEAAISQYENMTEGLMMHYGIQNTMNQINIDEVDFEKSGHGKLVLRHE